MERSRSSRQRASAARSARYRLPYAAFLRYSPRGIFAISKHSKDVTLAIKGDSFIRGHRVIDYAARRIGEERGNYPFLSAYFNASVTIVPAPRSSPLKNPKALWPALRICQSLKAQGCAAAVLPCLKRVKPVTKSATAGSGQRPDPNAHYESPGPGKIVVFCPVAIGSPRRLRSPSGLASRCSRHASCRSCRSAHQPKPSNAPQ